MSGCGLPWRQAGLRYQRAPKSSQHDEPGNPQGPRQEQQDITTRPEATEQRYRNENEIPYDDEKKNEKRGTSQPCTGSGRMQMRYVGVRHEVLRLSNVPCEHRGHPLLSLSVHRTLAAPAVVSRHTATMAEIRQRSSYCPVAAAAGISRNHRNRTRSNHRAWV
jgi:hypothetical protein